MRNYYVYIMSSNTGVLYVGVTNNLCRRNIEHKQKLNDGFTKRYNIYKLVYYEHYQYILNAIECEKQLKNWSRQKKIKLIRSFNPGWIDLGQELPWNSLEQ